MKILLFLIKAYRLLLSPFLGMHCRFTPSCSVYAMEAIEMYGAIKGSYFAIKRVLRCHPFADGGYDPVVPPPHGRDRIKKSNRKTAGVGKNDTI